MKRIIKSSELKVEDIPNIEKIDWNGLSEFALTFDPQAELGKTDIYDISWAKFDENSTLQDLRICLFLKQRWWNNKTSNIDLAGLNEMRAIVRLIRLKLSQ